MSQASAQTKRFTSCYSARAAADGQQNALNRWLRAALPATAGLLR
jgi:hypothetical protein